MDIIKNLKSRFDSVQCDFLIAIAAIFLPFYVTVVIHAIIFFKWIKQHLHIKAFYGTSQNAVSCQIWIATCTYLMIAIAKKKLDLAITLYTFAQTLGLTLFEKTPIKELFNNKNLIYNQSDKNQLSLWDS